MIQNFLILQDVLYEHKKHGCDYKKPPFEVNRKCKNILNTEPFLGVQSKNQLKSSIFDNVQIYIYKCKPNKVRKLFLKIFL